MQYLITVIVNKNGNKLKNKIIITELILVTLTIIIPIILLMLKVEVYLSIVPLYIILYIFFNFLNNNAHKVYIGKEKHLKDRENEIKKHNKKKVIKYISILFISGIFLYIISELLGNTIENLCILFYIPQIIIGIVLGIITSIPELITFVESQKYHKKSEKDIFGIIEATNNLLTSNSINLFIIQTIGILIINI